MSEAKSVSFQEVLSFSEELERTGICKELVLSKEPPKSNALYCKEYREKLQQEKQRLREENNRLKRERDLFEETISTLELEVQALRGQGAVDLAKENELLRHEIQKHRKYIKRIVDVTRETPLSIEQEETSRLMHNCSEATIAQLVGLMYSSTTDPCWTIGPELHPQKGVVVKMSCQYLPTGSTYHTAKRVNVRIDYEGLPLNADYFYDLCWKTCNNVSNFKATFAKGRDISQSRHPIFIDGNEGEIIFSKCLMSPKETPHKQAVLLASRKVVELFSSAFPVDPESSNAHQELVRTKGRVLFSSCSEVDLKDDSSFGEIKGVYYEGAFICETNKTTSKLTHITSAPMVKSFLELFDPTIGDRRDILAHVESSQEERVTEMLFFLNSARLNEDYLTAIKEEKLDC